ncbi:MAG TPA: DUF1592 domain-containing protein [Polyangiaceae bacterium]|nr:DUF1592 domain-containing protein [Polyangiaceae bacterium]
MKKLPTVPVLAMAALFVGCSGTIGDGLGDSTRPGGSSGSGTSVVELPPGTDPGRVALHRLNRAEYNNTVRDLLGTSLKNPAERFPPDDLGAGFDNMAELLTLSSLHLSEYQSAARTLVSEALGNAAQRAKLVPCDLVAQGEACARKVLQGFAYRAWRRPVTDAEIERLMKLAGVALANAETYERGLELALQAVLLSPHFVFRVELDADPKSLTPHPLNPYELASRLSYFLWSSTPDPALLESAASGALSQPAVLEQQVVRLLEDVPHARALVDNFAGQWLQLRNIDTLQPDPGKFSVVDPSLLSAMRAEGERLFQDVAFQGAPLKQLLTANYSYVNDRLAKHYGLAPVGSTELKRVDLGNNAERGGLLSQGGFLTMTSHPDMTSPVLRGKWVMETLLGTVIPDPPDNMGIDLTAVKKGVEAGLSQREANKQHSANPKCAACHKLMDPIGLGLENYDAIGRYRVTDAGATIDASGQLPSGQSFVGAKELAALVAADPDFAFRAASQLYTYALGRTPVDHVVQPSHMDGSIIEGLGEALTQNGYSFKDLVRRIVMSPTFTSRRGDPATEGTL